MSLELEKIALLNRYVLDFTDPSQLQQLEDQVSFSWLGAGTLIYLPRHTLPEVKKRAFRIPKGVAHLIQTAKERLLEYPAESVEDFAIALEQTRAGLDQSNSLFNKRHPNTQKIYNSPIKVIPATIAHSTTDPTETLSILDNYTGTKLSCKDFNVVQKINVKSGFGEIFLAHHKSGTAVILKTVTTRKNKEKNDEAFLREINILAQVTKTNHSNIVTYYGVFGDHYIGEPPAMVFAYMEGGNLLELLQTKKSSWSQKARFADDIVRGLLYLHELDVLHRDLKPANILLNRNQTRAKIGDFGFSCSVHDTKNIKEYVGTPEYAAPEMIQGKGSAGKDSDIYNLVLLLLVILTRAGLPKTPKFFFEHPDRETFLNGGDLAGNTTWPTEVVFIKPIINKASCFHRNSRPTIQQIAKTFDENMPKAPPLAASPALSPA